MDGWHAYANADDNNAAPLWAYGRATRSASASDRAVVDCAAAVADVVLAANRPQMWAVLLATETI